MEQLQIQTKSKEYPVFISPGLRHEVGSKIAELGLRASNYLIITDDKVAQLYLEEVKAGLGKDQAVYEYIMPSGEASKSFQEYYNIQTLALEKGLDRKSIVIALGGGVVGDLAGFVAATFMRGIPFIQVPTTLLAHDSSVGGKVAINHPLGKNLIGAFHQPSAVIYDIETFASLPDHEMRSGYAEVMKHALIWDEELYHWLREEISDLTDIKDTLAEQLLLRSISVKAAVVKEDETEKGIRAYLNFGHTLGHAIETEMGYGKITHGEAVAIGMIFAMKVSEEVFQKQLPIEEVKAWIKKYGFATEIPNHLNRKQLIEVMKKDKKTEHGVIRMVLLREIGKVEVVAVEEEVLERLLV